MVAQATSLPPCGSPTETLQAGKMYDGVGFLCKKRKLLQRKLAHIHNQAHIDVHGALQATHTFVPRWAVQPVVEVSEIPAVDILGELATPSPELSNLPFLSFGNYNQFDSRFIQLSNSPKLLQLQNVLQSKASGITLLTGKKGSGKTTTCFNFARRQYSIFLESGMSEHSSTFSNDFHRTFLAATKTSKYSHLSPSILTQCWLASRCLVFLHLCRNGARPTPVQWLCMQLSMKPNLPFFSCVVRIFEWLMKNFSSSLIHDIFENTAREMGISQIPVFIDDIYQNPKTNKIISSIFQGLSHLQQVALIFVGNYLNPNKLSEFLFNSSNTTDLFNCIISMDINPNSLKQGILLFCNK